jgi:hypothetical protein
MADFERVLHKYKRSNPHVALMSVIGIDSDHSCEDRKSLEDSISQSSIRYEI